jgi:6-phosphogluconolactonase
LRARATALRLPGYAESGHASPAGKTFMKRLISLGVVLTAALLLAGCKGFWNAQSSGGGGGGGGGGSASGVFYVLNQTAGRVAGFSFASGSTTPTGISGGTQQLQAAPAALAISPNGSFLYVSTVAGIYLFNIGSGGALTIGNSGQVISSDPAFAMQVDATGQWLVEAVSGAGTVNAIPLTSTGLYNTAIQEQSAGLPAANVQQLAVMSTAASTAAGANYIFVAMGAGGTAVVPFNPASPTPFGNAIAIAPVNSTGGANAVAVDPTNPLLYVGETVAVSGTQTGGLRVFQISSTKLSTVSGSPFPSGGLGPSAILPTSGYVYVANKAVKNSSVGNITGYSVTANTSGSSTTYTLAKINTVSAGTNTMGLAEDSTSTYLLAVNFGGSPDLNTYTFDATTKGQLDAGATAATGTDPVGAIAIAAVP